MDVHIVDGTYELFRYHFGPSNRDVERGATVGVVGTLLSMVEGGATHVGVATDHVVESFRNDLWPGYKDGSGVDPDLLSQFGPLEEVLATLGIAVMAMVEHEADDALAAMAAVAADDERVERVCICTPDKDLAQCVGGKVVQLDRRRGTVLDADAVVDKYGVAPASIPDWLGLVGDAADGFPGLPGWGAKSAAAVLRTYGHVDAIPDDPTTWDVKVRNHGTLAATLRDQRADALLFRRLATLELDAPVPSSVDDLRWDGPGDGASAACAAIDAPGLAHRAAALAAALADG